MSDVDDDWTSRAECTRRRLPPELFWPPDQENVSLVWQPDPRALAACAACPVSAPCLETAETGPNQRTMRAGLVWHVRRRRWINPLEVRRGAPTGPRKQKVSGR